MALEQSWETAGPVYTGLTAGFSGGEYYPTYKFIEWPTAPCNSETGRSEEERAAAMSVIYSKGDIIQPDTGEVVGRIRPTIYVSGPMFSQGHLISNIREATWAGMAAYRKGWAPVIPHYDVLGALSSGIVDAEYYLNIDLSILATCKAIVMVRGDWDAYVPTQVAYMSGTDKTGTQREYELATALGLDIYVTSEEIPWVH